MTQTTFCPMRALRALLTAACVLTLAACASDNRAPVIDRGVDPAAATPAAPDMTAAPVVLPPGYYLVRPGDTLIRIALDAGQNWRDIARWNALVDPNVIEVGQQLRIVPPEGETVASVRPVVPPKVDVKPLPGAAAASAPATAPATPAARDGDDNVTWTWPASNEVAASFDEAPHKGVSIAGKAGDPVFAAADGRVIYASNGLRGYGNLIIIKHNNTYLTAYAHNQTLLVKEDQNVRRGQKIAEMGATDSDRGVQLHFEVRRNGKPIDPVRVLPPR